MSADLQGGPSAALKVFVTACFIVWVAASYMALFALATVFWVAWLESRFHPDAFVHYAVALAIAIVSAIASLRLWKRVHDRPWLYPKAAKAFGIAVTAAGAAGGMAALWRIVQR